MKERFSIVQGNALRNGMHHKFKPCKGRYPDYALAGLEDAVALIDRALPCPIDYKAFSLNMAIRNDALLPCIAHRVPFFRFLDCFAPLAMTAK
jgi:hypothetical protein